MELLNKPKNFFGQTIFLSHVKMYFIDQGSGVFFFFTFSKDWMGTGFWQPAQQDLFERSVLGGQTGTHSLVSIILICTSHEAVFPVKGGVKRSQQTSVKAKWKVTLRTTQMFMFSRIKKVLGHRQTSPLTSPDTPSSIHYSRRWKQGVTLDQTLCCREFTRNVLL